MNTIPSFHSNQFKIMGGHKITHTQEHANACMTRFTEQVTCFSHFIQVEKFRQKRFYNTETTSFIRISIMQWLKSFHIIMIN